jgi:hypothetical protein
MPLQKLADQIIRVSRQQVSTPVLVTPSYLSLRRRFFVELVDTLASVSERTIRIDWCRGVPGPLSLVGHRIANLRASRINRALSRKHPAAAEVQVTASIGRPGADRTDLVLGICDGRLELPAWTTPIHLSGSGRT